MRNAHVVARYEFAGREPVGLIHSEDGQQYLHSDALGSVVLSTDLAGEIHRETLFDAWGKPLVESGTPANKFGFTGACWAGALRIKSCLRSFPS